MNSFSVPRSNEIRHGLRSPYRPDLAVPRGRSREGVGRRDGVAVVLARPRVVDVDAQDLAQERRRLLLRIVAGIAAAAAVADTEVQVAIRSERHGAAVVIGVGAVLDEHERLGRALDDVRSRRIRPVLGHDDVATVARVVDVQDVVGREARMEGDAEQTALAGLGDLVPDVHEIAGLQDAVVHDPDRAALLDDEQAIAAIAGVRHLRQRCEAADDRAERDRECGARSRQRACQRDRQQHECQQGDPHGVGAATESVHGILARDPWPTGRRRRRRVATGRPSAHARSFGQDSIDAHRNPRRCRPWRVG